MEKCPRCMCREGASRPTRSVSILSANPNVEAIFERSERDEWTFVALEALYAQELVLYEGDNPIAEFREDEPIRLKAGWSLIGISLIYECDD